MNKNAKRLNRRKQKRAIVLRRQRILIAAFGTLAMLLIAANWNKLDPVTDFSDIRMFEAIPENDTVIARFDVIDETGVVPQLAEMAIHREKPAAEDHQEELSVPIDVLFDMRNAEST